MVRKRRITAIDAYIRNLKGPKVDEKDWDFKIIPEATAKAVREAGIKIEKGKT
ncbi:MAG: hypothetical protein H3Z50_05625 [archaeon]|nr:hypothetical protein [archaeon]MCP8305976.1 hypothetical protein [archaeon]